MVAIAKKEFEEVTFTKEKFGSEDLRHKYFANCVFEQCDLSRADLSNTKFHDCVFKSCNFGLAKIDNSRWQNVRFIDSKLVGLDFTKCNTQLFSVLCTRSLLESCNFSGLNLSNCQFNEATLRNCHFSECNLQGVDFRKSSLKGTIFHKTDLRKCDFRESTGYHIDPTTNKVNGAKFSMPEAQSITEALGIIIE